MKSLCQYAKCSKILLNLRKVEEILHSNDYENLQPLCRIVNEK